jgi:hypothetical protein
MTFDLNNKKCVKNEIMSQNIRIKVKLEKMCGNSTNWLLIKKEMKTINDIKVYLKEKYGIKESFNCFVDNVLVSDSESIVILRDDDLMVLKAIHSNESKFDLVSNESISRKSNSNPLIKTNSKSKKKSQRLDSTNSQSKRFERRVSKRNRSVERSVAQPINDSNVMTFLRNCDSIEPFIDLERVSISDAKHLIDSKHQSSRNNKKRR